MLASCDSARLHVADGAELIELIELSAALLALGTTTLVAALVPVPDEAGRALIVRFHRHRAGRLDTIGAARDEPARRRAGRRRPARSAWARVSLADRSNRAE